MLKEWLTRLRFLIAPKRRHEIDEELQLQIEANLAAGMTPQEARRLAVIAFGGIEGAKEGAHEQRPSVSIETFLQDTRYALRGFARSPIFTVTVVATLMLGIGATTAVFSVVDRILFRPLPYANGDRLVSVGMVHSLETEFMLGYFYYDWQRKQKPFETLTSEDAVTSECDLTDRSPKQITCDSVGGIFAHTGRHPCSGAELSTGRRSSQRARGSSHLLRPLVQSLWLEQGHPEQNN